MTPELASQLSMEREMEGRNRPLSDEELDAMFPPKGYKILSVPGSYVPLRTPSRKLLATPSAEAPKMFVRESAVNTVSTSHNRTLTSIKAS